MTHPAPIDGLTPLARLRDDLVAGVSPTDVRRVAPFAALGAVLAEDVVVAQAVPPAAVALAPGFAVASTETVGAAPYAPAMPSRLVAIAAGEPLPVGTDTVIRASAVSRDAGLVLVQQAAAPGENLRRAGEDFPAGRTIAAAGGRFDARGALLAETVGLAEVAIRRPRVALVPVGGHAAETAVRFLAAVLDRRAEPTSGSIGEDADPADLVLVVGAAAIAPDDPALAHLAARGTLLGSGVALVGAESLAWGRIGDRPALVLPSRPEALVAVLLALVEPLLAAAAGAARPAAGDVRPLARKIVSRVGLSEIALLAATAEARWTPLAVGDLAWQALARAEAWIELPPESEGFAESTPVAAARLPSSFDGARP